MLTIEGGEPGLRCRTERLPLDAPYLGVALYAPDPQRTLKAWVRTGLALEYSQDADPLLQDLVWAFKNYGEDAERILSDPRLKGAWVGATYGQSPFILQPSQAACPDGSGAAHWSDFFDVRVDDDTGDESLFSWLEDEACDIDVTARLTQAVDDVLYAAYSEAGSRVSLFRPERRTSLGRFDPSPRRRGNLPAGGWQLDGLRLP